MTNIVLKPDEMWCVWYSPGTGVFEFICGPDKADELLNGGMTKIDGMPVRVEVVDKWPRANGIQIRATSTVVPVRRENAEEKNTDL